MLGQKSLKINEKHTIFFKSWKHFLIKFDHLGEFSYQLTPLLRRYYVKHYKKNKKQQKKQQQQQQQQKKINKIETSIMF